MGKLNVSLGETKNSGVVVNLGDVHRGGGTPNAVQYIPQSLTEEQQAQARENIGAVARSEIKTEVNAGLELAKSSGEFDGKDGSDGKDGEDGGFYAPSLSPDGTLMFIPSKANMLPVGSVGNVKGRDGEDGEDGYTPVKGVDYFTPADKAEIIDDAITEVMTNLGSNSLNIFNKDDVTLDKCRNFNIGKLITNIIDKDGWWCSNQVWKCRKGDIIRVSVSWYTQYLIYDTNGVCIAVDSFDDTKTYTVANDSAVYFTIQGEDQADSKLAQLMVTLNNDMPSVFTPYTKNLLDRVSDLEKGASSKAYFSKPFVVLSFDAFNLTDNRFAIVHDEYGYKATVAHKTKDDIEINKKVLAAGWDIGLYQLNGNPARVDGQYDAAVSQTPTAEILQAWEDYVKAAVDDAAEAMVFNPVVWLSSQGCSCYGLEQALKKYGIPMCRGSYNPDYSNDWEYSSAELPTMTVAVKQTLMPSTLEACKTNISEAVTNGTGVAFLTHGIYATDTEANNNYGITEACLRGFLDTVKSYVDAGQLEMVTYRDIYAKYYPDKAKELDYNRIVKMVTGINVAPPENDEGTDTPIQYTNVIKTSVGSDGAIFNNGKGWADNSRIGSGGIYLNNGSYYVTGHIEIDPNIDNVIRLENMTFDKTTNNNYANGIFFFNASFAKQKYNGSSDVAYPDSMAFFSPVYDGNNIVQFTIPASAVTDKTVKYFAICCTGISDNSIITINEPIE